MPLPSELVKETRTAEPTTDAMEAARRMDRFGVGALVVVQGRRPVGIVTDRDLALFVLEQELDPATCPVSRCMNEDLVVLPIDADVGDAIALLRRHGIRRLPIVDGAGELVGIVAADDLLEILAGELGSLVCAVRNELTRAGTGQTGLGAALGKE